MSPALSEYFQRIDDIFPDGISTHFLDFSWENSSTLEGDDTTDVVLVPLMRLSEVLTRIAEATKETAVKFSANEDMLNSEYTLEVAAGLRESMQVGLARVVGAETYEDFSSGVIALITAQAKSDEHLKGMLPAPLRDLVMKSKAKFDVEDLGEAAVAAAHSWNYRGANSGARHFASAFAASLASFTVTNFAAVLNVAVDAS